MNLNGPRKMAALEMTALAVPFIDIQHSGGWS